MMLFLLMTFFHQFLWASAESDFHLFLSDWKEREVHIYLPTGYNEGEDFPVLIMHDGQNLYDSRRSYNGQTWRAIQTLNFLIQNKIILPIVVIAIDNRPKRTWDYTPDFDPTIGKGGEAKLYLEEIIFELLPLVRKNYKITSHAKKTAMMGSSLGGLLSLFAGSRYPHFFGLIGALSPSLWWNQKSIFKTLIEAPALPQKIYMDSGGRGGERPWDVTKLGFELKKRMSSGDLKTHISEEHDHSEVSWAARFHLALIHLYPHNSLESKSPTVRTPLDNH